MSWQQTFFMRVISVSLVLLAPEWTVVKILKSHRRLPHRTSTKAPYLSPDSPWKIIAEVWVIEVVEELKLITFETISFGRCALGSMLGILDILGVEVRNREQVEVTENVEARETEEEIKTKKQTCDDMWMKNFHVGTSCDTLSCCTKKCRQLTPPSWWCPWTSNSGSIVLYIPCKKSHFPSKSRGATDQQHALHFPAMPKKPSAATWLPTPLCWKAPSFLRFSESQFSYWHGLCSIGFHFDGALQQICATSILPFSVVRNPSIFCTKSTLLPACPFFLPYRVLPCVAFTIFPNSLPSMWTMHMSLHLHVLAASSTSHAILAGRGTPLRSMPCFPFFLVHTSRFFFWLRLEFLVLQFLHQAVNACGVLQGCIHFLHLAVPRILHPPSHLLSPIRRPFPLLSMTNFSQFDISFLSTSTMYFVVNWWNSQILIHNPASTALGSIQFLSPLHCPSVIPLLLTCTLMGPITFLSKKKKTTLPLLLCALNLKFWIHSAIHPMQKSHFSIKIQRRNWPTTCSPLSCNAQGNPSAATWSLQPLCWKSSPLFALLRIQLFTLKWDLFHWLSLRRCVTIPLCHFHSFENCDGEVIVQGDESPVVGVAQGVCSLSRTHRQSWGKGGRRDRAGSRERWREHSRNAAHVHGWDDYGRQVRTAWAMWCDEWIQTTQLRTACSVLNAAWFACPRASRHSCCCPLWSHRCSKCACRCTHFS